MYRCVTKLITPGKKDIYIVEIENKVVAKPYFKQKGTYKDSTYYMYSVTINPHFKPLSVDQFEKVINNKDKRGILFLMCIFNSKFSDRL